MALLAALCVSAASSPLPAAAAVGQSAPGDDSASQIGIRLAEAPVSRRSDPRALAYIVDHVHPGTTIKRRFEVKTTMSAPQPVELYPGAADVKENEFAVAEGHAGNELTSWISLNTPSLDLPKRGQRTAEVEINVPPDASKGERYGVIWAETKGHRNGSDPIEIVSRVGIRIYLDVGPGGEPPSDFRIESLTPARTVNGQPELRAQVRNTGGRALDMSGTLILSEGPAGLRAGPFSATQGVTLAPGDSGLVSVLLDERLPSGPWKAELTLKSGIIERKVTASITFPDAPGAGRPIWLLSDSWKFTLLALAAVLILLVAGGILVVRRRRVVRSRSLVS